MPTLYVDRKEIELSASSGVLRFHEPTGRRGSVPLAHLDRVVVRGRAKISTSTLGAIADAGAGIVVLSGRRGRHLATIVGRPHNDVLRRLGQFDAYRDASARLQWSKDLIAAKTNAQINLLRKALSRRPDRRRDLTRALRQLEETQRRLDAPHHELRIAVLLGMEGAAAAAYFKAYATLLPKSLDFQGRRKRPPTDPVNACLSLAYTLLHFEGVSASHEAGLDPLLGLYHEPAYGRESLAADAIEPFRPYVDAWVWSLFRERILTETGFSRDGRAVLLNKRARLRFYEQFNPLATALRRLLRRQLRRAAREFERRARARNLAAPAQADARDTSAAAPLDADATAPEVHSADCGAFK